VKLAFVLTPATVAVMVTVPAFVPVVYFALAVPAVMVVPGFAEKVPPAPPSLKLTDAPGMALPKLSVTFATNALGSMVDVAAFCPLPVEAITLDAGFGVTVTKIFSVVNPVTAAVTVVGPDFVEEV